MKNFIFALIVSIAIHFILLVNFKDISIKETYQKSSKDTTTKYTYISLANIKQPKEIKKVIKKPKKVKALKKIIQKKTITKVLKKSKYKSKVKYKKVYKRNIKPAVRQKNKKIKSVFTTKRKERKKNLIKKIEKPIKVIPKEIVKKELILNLDREYQELQQLDNLTKSYLRLYGDEYFKLSNNQKKYLKENLNIIGKITQEYLIYPYIAIKTKQRGTNVVEFILKPNGDITNLKITDSSSYSTLDRNTIKTIKIAYKDYPKPKEATKIKIYVRYILY